jgi:hypothetical protein
MHTYIRIHIYAHVQTPVTLLASFESVGFVISA